MKRILFWLGILILLSSNASAQSILYGEETLDITLEVDDCHATTTVFRLERLNYSTGVEPLTIDYSYVEYGIHNYSLPVSKTINKYSSSQTGEFNASNAPQQIGLNFGQNTTLLFDTTALCGTIVTPDTNESTPHNTTNENASSEEETTLNETSTTPVDIIIIEPEEETETTSCATNELAILPSTKVLALGERLQFSFAFTHEPESYEIDYWIEDAKESTVKKKVTTSNTNTKSYTLAKSLTAGSYLTLHARAQTPCSTLTTSELVGIAQEAVEETVVLEVKERSKGAQLSLSIENAATTDYTIHVLNHKGKEMEQLATLHLQEGGNTNILLPITLEVTGPFAILEARSADRRYTVYHALPEQEVQPRREENDAHIIRSYTRQTKMSEVLNWYVRSEGTPPYTVRVRSGNESFEKTITTSDAQTHSFEFRQHNDTPRIWTEITQHNKSYGNETTLTLTRDKPLREPPAQPNVSSIPLTGAVTAEIPSKTNKAILLAISILVAGILWQQRRLIKEATFIKRWWPLRTGETHGQKRNKNQD